MALSRKCGLILSGLTGVGKTTLRSALLQEGCWAPRLLTSRGVDRAEDNLVQHVARTQFVHDVHIGKLVAPVIFAGNLYAWPRLDFQRLQEEPAGAVVSARPYTALLLGAAIPGLIPVWLDLPEKDRHERLARRAGARDQGTLLAERRLERDSEDIFYRELFAVRILSDETAFAKLVHLVEGNPFRDRSAS